MNTYLVCKKLIASGTYTTASQKSNMRQKLDIFLLSESITNEEYQELIGLLTA